MIRSHYFALFSSLLLFITGPVCGSVTVSVGSGSAVSSVDRMATFDDMTFFGSHDLASYTEGDLYIQTPDSWQNWPLQGGGVWYPNTGFSGGNSAAENMALIGTTDSARMYGIEFDVFSGGVTSIFTTFSWETYRDGSLTGSGTLDANTVVGDTIAFQDIVGIDELRVGVFAAPPNFSNPIGIDNLRVQITQIPEPSALMLVTGLALGAVCRRRR